MEPSSASAIARLLSRLGFSHVVGVPDNTSAALFSAFPEVTPGIRDLFATREGEAIALAAGLWLGGARPAVVIQNTGLLEAGDGLRGTASRMGVPLLLLITCRGYARARARGINPDSGPVDRDVLVRADLDSVAHMTEKTLRAWGIPFHPLRDPADLTPVSEAWNQALTEGRPVAVLVDTPLT